MVPEVAKRKLIEVSLPLEAINRESSRENYIYKGNPSSVHKWWSQKPLATVRSVLFAQLVDDPSSRPLDFPTDDDQRRERERLHKIIERLAVWENANDSKVIAEARAEILKSTNGSPPTIIDPFAGGGTIPLEAQRLGLEVYASDLNPVAVLITKSLTEYPANFKGQPPVFPGLAESEIRSWRGVEGLAADVRAYGEWIRDEAESRIGNLYPKSDGNTAIAWIWARTVVCPNPACRIEMPLTSKWWLGKRKGHEAYVVPSISADESHPSGLRVHFAIGHERDRGPKKEDDGTVGRSGGKCIACGSAVDLSHVRAEGVAGRIGHRLLATVVDVKGKRVYVAPDPAQEAAARVDRPENVPDARIPDQALSFRVQAYGMTRWSDLFTNRELTALTAFSDLVQSARVRVIQDGGSEDYANAISTFLAFAVSKLADYVNSLSAWYPQENRPTHLFTSQAVPMMWDYAELNPLTGIGGGWTRSVKIVSESFEQLVPTGRAKVDQGHASDMLAVGALLSTDPPYYSSIGYSDLSDFFYVWLRRTLRDVHPALLSTVLVPKAEELVANPYRHNGKGNAKSFFEAGFHKVFAEARVGASDDFPITVYYAFKQSESDSAGEASTGWETFLTGMILSGWEITSTWPMRSERGGRMISVGTNALASSIVLALRPRPSDAPMTDRRGFLSALQGELPSALRKLQQGTIAPVDLPQAAIGPGMAVFSRYAQVVESDGSRMSVRSALATINEILDQVLSEQEGDFDAVSRFAISWYRQHGYGTGVYGDADNLARARNTSVDFMVRNEILVSGGNKVTLIRPLDTPESYDVLTDPHTSAWEGLHNMIRVLETKGVPSAGDFLATATSREDGAIDADLVKELAFLLFSIAEKNAWTKDAIFFNNIASSWAEILDASRSVAPRSTQGAFDFEEDQ